MIRSKLCKLVGTVAIASALAVPMLATSASPASADWGRRGQYYGGGHWHGGGGCWNCGFVPGLAVGLGIAGVAALATAPYYVAPPPVYYAPPPPVYYAPPPGYYYYYR